MNRRKAAFGPLSYGLAAAALLMPVIAQAQVSSMQRPAIKSADPSEKGGGALGPAAREAIIHGPLPASAADVAVGEAAPG